MDMVHIDDKYIYTHSNTDTEQFQIFLQDLAILVVSQSVCITAIVLPLSKLSNFQN